jgi:hypothetical protein
MDPISPQAANLVSNLQALLVRQGTAGFPLMALLGQEVEALFQAATAGGVKLQLPSGQTVTAQGELPYPEGTLLRLRILPAASGETGLRLQLQEARPPAPPALLSPLTQSEAATLAARLSQDSPPAELAPLVRLLSLLSDVPGIAPSNEQLQAALSQLPGTLLSSLGQALDAGSMASIPELSAALQGFLQELRTAMPTGNQLLEAELPEGRDKPLQELIQQGVTRFQTLLSQHAEIPEGEKSALLAWLRNLLRKAAGAPLQLPKLPERVSSDARSGRAAAAEALIPAKLVTALQSHAGSKAELPESWETWIRGTVTTLSDPAISPREAAFHALQAKEGTAFFELPLPWAQAGLLQIWVESDAPEQEGQPGGDGTKRVLLGLRFSNLGETRLGLAQGSFGLQIRIWTERPEALEAQKERIKEELKDLGKAVDLKIYALTQGAGGTIPSVRSLVVGPSLRALG